MTLLLKKRIKNLALVLVVGGTLLLGVPALERATAPTVVTKNVLPETMHLSVLDIGPVSYTHLDVYKRQALH